MMTWDSNFDISLPFMELAHADKLNLILSKI